VLGASGHRDGPDDTLPLIGILRELVRRSVPPYGAQVATALGMVAYQYGDGALASVACERALADDPLASGALLLGELIQRQVHPREVRRSSRQAGRDLARRRL
jgi:hypothetical protein